MYLCDDHHAEVCYDRGGCPVCETIKEKSALEDEIYDLKEEIEELKKEE